MKTFILSIMLAFSLAGTAQNVSDTVYTVCDTMPEFPGGTDSLYSFIYKNLRWPNTEMDFQGRVVVRFVVTKEGKVKDPKIIRGIYRDADKEALRVIRMMPDWVPGKRDGENVNVYFNIPIVFRLEY